MFLNLLSELFDVSGSWTMRVCNDGAATTPLSSYTLIAGGYTKRDLLSEGI